MGFNYDLLVQLSNLPNEIKAKVPSSKLFNDLINNYDEIISYINSEFKDISICNEQLANSLFIANYNKDFFRKNLYSLGVYLKRLRDGLKEDNVYRYATVIQNILAELDWGISNYEIQYRQIEVEKTHCYGRRVSLNNLDRLFAIRELFFIEEAPTIESITLRDIKPNVMFIIRQMLEQKWKNVIGYDTIVDGANNNAPIHKFTQVAWTFINEYSKKSDKSWDIVLPLSIATLDHLNKWANSFVHDSWIYADHIQFLAIELIHVLMTSPQDCVSIFKNTPKPSFQKNLLAGNIRINGYNQLKKDFEEYIKNKMKNAKIMWLSETQVEAYIETI